MAKPQRTEPSAAQALPDSPMPLYHQILLVLRERIEHGYYGRGGLLPSELEVSREFRVARVTAARAMNELASLGLVERRRGAGTRIVPQQVPAPVIATIDDFVENLTEMGKRTQVRVLEFGFVLPGKEVQAELAIGPDDLVQRAVRVRSYEGRPFSHLTTFIPGSIGRKFDEKDLATHSLISLLEQGGVEVGSARQTFGAVLADPQIGAALEVPVGSPLLSVLRTVSDRDDRPVEFIRILYRPDRYQYRMAMDRRLKGSSKIWSIAQPGQSG